MIGADPLKIYYFVVLETDDPEKTTAFQGFSISWKKLHWALHLLSTLPADVLERSYKIDDVIAQRMGNGRSLYWFPINIGSLEQFTAEEIGVFIVCFTGEEAAARRTTAWIKSQAHPVLHISSGPAEGACHLDDFSIDRLHQYCLETLAARKDALTSDRQEAATTCLAKWQEPARISSGIRELQHNVLIPNHMSLARAARTLEKGQPFIGHSEGEYTAVILESMEAVYRVREEVGIRPLHRLMLPNPGIILTEPAFFRHAYGRVRPEGRLEDRDVAKTLRYLQIQRGFHNEFDRDYVLNLLKSRTAQLLLNARQSELMTHTLGIGLKAAQTCSSVMRLSPAVNHVFPALSAYAASVRSHKLQARLKARRLFAKIQNGLKEAVGDERMTFIEKKGGPLKIVSDAPIEWLPVGNLPLSLRYDCSRINATPGNLMMGLLTHVAPLTFEPQQLQKILILSSFTDGDPLKNVLTRSINVLRAQWDNKVEVVFEHAKSQKDFVEVLNRFDGYILIFDGHGADNSDEPVGKLIIGSDSVNVWDLRGEVRIPPIVVLSACDTHGIDASTQATVGNGFLALHARTVLATLLPVGGLASAAFISRLVYRLADFLPAVMSAEKRVLNWTEVIAGMLRMLFASEMLDHLVGPPAPQGTPRGKLQLEANMDINTREEAWFDNLIAAIAEHHGVAAEAIASKAAGVIAHCEAIRYVQLGNPETILIDDGRIRDLVMKEYSAGKAN
jgi:hypothetical protein